MHSPRPPPPGPKHGALFRAQREALNLHAPPKDLSVEDMWVPTCATCHMSGLEGQRVTHDMTERLSYWLFAEVSEKRPTYAQGQAQMKEVCLSCHTTPHVERFYEEAEAVLVGECAGRGRDRCRPGVLP